MNQQVLPTVRLSVRNVLLMESQETHSMVQAKYAWNHALLVNLYSMRLLMELFTHTVSLVLQTVLFVLQQDVLNVLLLRFCIKEDV